jgi:hypothetical protein
MTDDAAELAKIRSLCKDAELWDEGGKLLVFLPGLKIHSGGALHTVDGLLCPRPRDSYATRLFLSKPFPAKGRNWKTYNIKGRTWHACSWKDVPASLPWLEILACHLDPLK